STGEVRILSNCGLVSEGFDVPAIEAVLLARPTQSLAMYLQMVGRALRLAPGKKEAIILDVAGNMFRHGLPDADRQWSLEDQPKQQKDGGEPKPRTCKRCFTVNKPEVLSCIACGESLVTPQERIEVEVELRRIEDLKQFEALRNMNYGAALRWAGPN